MSEKRGELKDEFRSLRKRNKLTQERLARLLGLAPEIRCRLRCGSDWPEMQNARELQAFDSGRYWIRTSDPYNVKTLPDQPFSANMP